MHGQHLPLADGRSRVSRSGQESKLTDRFEIVSAGTGDWHVGEPPHRGTRETLKRHGIEPNGLIAKHVSQAMLDRADYVVAMDYENLADLRSWRIDRKKVSRILDYALDVDVRDVPDPYYDGRFELVYELVSLGARRLAATNPRTAQLLTSACMIPADLRSALETISRPASERSRP